MRKGTRRWRVRWLMLPLAALAVAGEYFLDGAWTRPTTTMFGPSLKAPVVPLGAF